MSVSWREKSCKVVSSVGPLAWLIYPNMLCCWRFSLRSCVSALIWRTGAWRRTVSRCLLLKFSFKKLSVSSLPHSRLLFSFLIVLKWRCYMIFCLVQSFKRIFWGDHFQKLWNALITWVIMHFVWLCIVFVSLSRACEPWPDLTCSCRTPVFRR